MLHDCYGAFTFVHETACFFLALCTRGMSFAVIGMAVQDEDNEQTVKVDAAGMDINGRMFLFGGPAVVSVVGHQTIVKFTQKLTESEAHVWQFDMM